MLFKESNEVKTIIFPDSIGKFLTTESKELILYAQEDLEHSFELLGEGLRALPLGILFSFNPLTLLPAGAIFSGIIEGIAGIFKAIFVW